MDPVVISSPAKLNFFLAVTGRRPDGFHDIVSVAAQLDFGDTLRLEPLAGGSDSLECAMPGVPLDVSNLVLRAARAWRDAGGGAPPVRFVLEKRVPPESGLGGGSGNAVATLRGLERAASRPLGAAAIERIAASIGSDCTLFLHGGPVIMRGRGEQIEPLPEPAAARLCAGELLVIRPGVGVGTAWAYGRLVRGAPGSYLDGKDAEARVAAWIAGGENDALSFNSFEPVVFEKFVGLPVLARRLERRHGLKLRLSGSGSACFAWLRDETKWDSLVADVREALGEGCLAVRTRVVSKSLPQRD